MVAPMMSEAMPIIRLFLCCPFMVRTHFSLDASYIMGASDLSIRKKLDVAVENTVIANLESSPQIPCVSTVVSKSCFGHSI